MLVYLRRRLARRRQCRRVSPEAEVPQPAAGSAVADPLAHVVGTANAASAARLVSAQQTGETPAEDVGTGCSWTATGDGRAPMVAMHDPTKASPGGKERVTGAPPASDVAVLVTSAWGRVSARRLRCHRGGSPARLQSAPWLSAFRAGVGPLHRR